MSKAKASQITAHMNHSETGESSHLFYHRLLLLDKDLSIAWSPLGPEDTNYKSEILIIRKKYSNFHWKSCSKIPWHFLISLPYND